MKASKLISLLMGEVLSKGDGEFENFSIHSLEVDEDEDHSGKVTKRTFVLQM